MSPNIEILQNEKLVAGKSPYWDHEAQVLYYVDVFESTVFKYVPSTKKITRVVVDKQKKAGVSFAIPVAGTSDRFVIGNSEKLAVLTWDGDSADPTSIETLVELQPGTDSIFSDGKADAQGRLWVGTMGSNFQFGAPPTKYGELYSLNSHFKSLETHVSNVGMSNGLTWSSDRKTFYWIDSFTWAIDAFDYNIDSGKIANRRTVYDLKSNNVSKLPDGMTIDKEDKLWFTVYGEGIIYNVDPKTGSLIQSVKLPITETTSVAWGGPNLDELYVASGSFVKGKGNPHSGSLFKVTGLGTSGLPAVPVKL